jgi:hypothetical protein
MRMLARRVAGVAIALAIGGGSRVAAQAVQAEPPLVGPARDIARALIIGPAVFDPLLVSPLAPEPQAVVDVHSSDIAATAHAALRNGDDSYGIIASAPISSGSTQSSIVDPGGLRPHPSLGFDLTNVIWRPRARRALDEILRPDGFARLSPETRTAVARAIEAGDAVDVPWVVFFHASYQFNRGEYQYADAATGAPRSETRLNDTASVLGGAQFLVKGTDPGYFVGLSYIYSAVFHDAAAVGGAVVGGPLKVRANSIRLELRRLLPSRRVGINPSYTHDITGGDTTVDVSTYALFTPSASHDSVRMSAGVRVGHRTGADGGTFVTVFAGPVFGSRP